MQTACTPCTSTCTLDTPPALCICSHLAQALTPCTLTPHTHLHMHSCSVHALTPCTPCTLHPCSPTHALPVCSPSPWHPPRSSINKYISVYVYKGSAIYSMEDVIILWQVPLCGCQLLPDFAWAFKVPWKFGQDLGGLSSSWAMLVCPVWEGPPATCPHGAQGSLSEPSMGCCPCTPPGSHRRVPKGTAGTRVALVWGSCHKDPWELEGGGHTFV